MSEVPVESVLDAFERITVESVEAEMATVEAALEALTATHAKRLDALRELRKVLLIRRDGKPQRVPRGGRKPQRPEPSPKRSGDEPGLRPGSAADLISQHLRMYGRQTPQEIARSIQPPIKYATIYGTLQTYSARFEKHPDGRYGLLQS